MAKFYKENEKYFDTDSINKGKKYFYEKGYLPEKVHDFYGIGEDRF